MTYQNGACVWCGSSPCEDEAECGLLERSGPHKDGDLDLIDDGRTLLNKILNFEETAEASQALVDSLKES